jgi:hypothetical protein
MKLMTVLENFIELGIKIIFFIFIEIVSFAYIWFRITALAVKIVCCTVKLIFLRRYYRNK